MSEPGAISSKSIVSTVNCVGCQQRKVKCSRTQPCTLCEQRGIECVYVAPKRKGLRRGVVDALRKEIRLMKDAVSKSGPNKAAPIQRMSPETSSSSQDAATLTINSIEDVQVSQRSMQLYFQRFALLLGGDAKDPMGSLQSQVGIQISPAMNANGEQMLSCRGPPANGAVMFICAAIGKCLEPDAHGAELYFNEALVRAKICWDFPTIPACTAFIFMAAYSGGCGRVAQASTYASVANRMATSLHMSSPGCVPDFLNDGVVYIQRVLSLQGGPLPVPPAGARSSAMEPLRDLLGDEIAAQLFPHGSVAHAFRADRNSTDDASPMVRFQEQRMRFSNGIWRVTSKLRGVRHFDGQSIEDLMKWAQYAADNVPPIDSVDPNDASPQLGVVLGQWVVAKSVMVRVLDLARRTQDALKLAALITQKIASMACAQFMFPFVMSPFFWVYELHYRQGIHAYAERNAETLRHLYWSRPMIERIIQHIKDGTLGVEDMCSVTASCPQNAAAGITQTMEFASISNRTPALQPFPFQSVQDIRSQASKSTSPADATGIQASGASFKREPQAAELLHTSSHNLNPNVLGNGSVESSDHTESSVQDFENELLIASRDYDQIEAEFQGWSSVVQQTLDADSYIYPAHNREFGTGL